GRPAVAREALLRTGFAFGDDPPASDLADAGFASGFASGFDAASPAGFSVDDPAFSAGLSSLPPASRSLSTRLRLLSLSVLKSVSYQPPPLRRKTGAETSLVSLFLPHSVHLRSGASVIFCSTSTCAPQAEHSYS